MRLPTALSELAKGEPPGTLLGMTARLGYADHAACQADEWHPSFARHAARSPTSPSTPTL